MDKTKQYFIFVILLGFFFCRTKKLKEGKWASFSALKNEFISMAQKGFCFMRQGLLFF